MSLDVWFQQYINKPRVALYCPQTAQPARIKALGTNARLESGVNRAGFEAAPQSVGLAFGTALDSQRPGAGKRVPGVRLRLKEPMNLMWRHYPARAKVCMSRHSHLVCSKRNDQYVDTVGESSIVGATLAVAQAEGGVSITAKSATRNDSCSALLPRMIRNPLAFSQ
jgi:hypothetical protein